MTRRDAARTAIAPGKVILFGEHAVNYGQPALSAAVGLYARCRVTPLGNGGEYRFRSGRRTHSVSRQQIARLARQVEACRAREEYEAIRRLAAEDYFAPAQYVLASVLGEALPDGLEVEWESEIPPSSGLGSGGAAFVAMVSAIAPLFPELPSLEQRAAWAYRGDIVAHGGIASALDTQTSLLGGVRRFTGQELAEPVHCAPGLSLVIGHTGVVAATNEVNERVRRWLAERPASRTAYLRTIGALSRAALRLMELGDWEELGRLLTLNQMALEKIGVSCPEIDRLIDAALGAGAWGAKLSGSGGGGIIIALTSPENCLAVAQAITAAGGAALTPEIGVPGARLEETLP
jgi:mevalonate kinase